VKRAYPSFIAGLTYPSPSGGSRERYVAKHLRDGVVVDLIAEPDNPHDPDAVAVYHEGFHLGYLPRKHHWVSESLAEGDILRAVVTAIDTEGLLSQKATHVDLQIQVLADG